MTRFYKLIGENGVDTGALFSSMQTSAFLTTSSSFMAFNLATAFLTLQDESAQASKVTLPLRSMVK